MSGEQTIAELRAQIEAGGCSERVLRALAQGDPRRGVRELATRALTKRREAKRERARLARLLWHERELWQRGVLHVAGVDEVGVGPMAGPVVAAAVILAPGTSVPGINDSKVLTAQQREDIAAHIRQVAVAWCVGEANLADIEALNIYHAALEAMRRAVTGLRVAPEHLLVDARTVPGVPAEQTALIKGDARSQSIAAASILAKVHRDERMVVYAQQYPGYGFEEHKGYPTPEHRAALVRLGPCPIHRRTWATVAAVAERTPRQLLLPTPTLGSAGPDVALPPHSRGVVG